MRAQMAKAALAAVVSAGVLTAAAACSSGSGSKAGSTPSGGGSGGSSGSASASATPNGVEKLSPREIVDRSTQALKNAHSAHIAGSVTSGGQQSTIDLATDTDANCTGSVGQSGQGTFQIIKVGKQLWLKPDASFWQTHGGPATAQLVGDKYLKTTTDNADFADTASLCDLGQLADSIAKTTATLTPGTQTTIDGKPVVSVNGSENGQPGSLYVATSGQPYPVRLERNGTGDTAKIDFKDFGVPVKTTTPSPDQTLDVDQLNKEIGGQSKAPSSSPSV